MVKDEVQGGEYTENSHHDLYIYAFIVGDPFRMHHHAAGADVPQRRYDSIEEWHFPGEH